MLKEKMQSEIISAVLESANPMKVSAMDIATNPNDNGMRLSNLDTSQPDTGRPMRELIGMNSSIVPSSASFRSKCSLMVGILEAQVEKQTPERRKKTLR